MTFDDLWAAGLANARTRLATKSPAAANLANRVVRPSFPGAVALLVDPRVATAAKGPDFLRSIAGAVAADSKAQAKGLDAKTVEAILTAQAGRAARLAIADDVIVNTASPEALGTQVATLHRRYLALSTMASP